jgi:anti-sigma28 factor (negative regulator of flagellin synthesis)
VQISNNLQTSNIASALGLGPASSKTGSQKGPMSLDTTQDQVSISSLASQIASDPSKLSQLQASYEAGTYSVSPSQVANRLINDSMFG